MGFFDTIKILYSYLRPYRKRIWVGLFALLLVDILNAFPPLVLKKFIDQAELTFKGDQQFKPYLILGILFLWIAILQGVLRYIWRQMLIKSSHRAAEKIREDYFRKLQTLPPSFYDKHPIGDLMSLATNDVEAVRFALGPGLLVFADAVFLFLAIPPAMLILSPKLTLITLIPLFFVPFVMGWLEKQVFDRFKKVQEQFSKLTTFSQENIEGIRIVKAFVREWTQINRFANLGKEFILLNLKLGKIQGLIEPVFIIALNLGTVFLIVFAGPMVVKGDVELGTFVAFTRYLDQLVWPLTAIGLAVTYYLRGKGSLTRIIEVLKVKDNLEIISNIQNKDNDSNNELLSIENLTFQYPNTDNNLISKRNVLKNISISIKKNEWVAFVGPIGSGKSTLTKIIAGHYPYHEGNIFWNGVNVKSMSLSERREKLSVVPQELFLFSDTISANVELGSKGKPISETVMYTLLSDSMFIDGNFTNINSEVGERGSYLSGGQRARLTIARSFARSSELLILDDALSSVDVKTENKIMKSLLAKRKDGSISSLLMITHRFSAMNHFDRIYVFKDGEVIDQGTPQELMNRPGLFQTLYQLQKMEDELNVESS